MRTRFLLALLCFAGVAATSCSAPVRLVVVPADAESASAADLLTVVLSTNDQVVLVERVQLDKVLREQATAAGVDRDFIKLGELFGADGLLVLQTVETDDRPKIAAILVAVKPGVILRQATYEWPSPEPARWAELVVRQMRDLFPKLAVLPKDALPVSILNLRASVSSPAAMALERELTRLLYDRLAREREVFVLERRRMETLSAEKELKGLAETAFWSSGHLIEGIINKEGLGTNTVTISGRIISPDKTNVVTIEIAGVRTNLAGVIKELSNRILAAVRRTGTAAEWNPLAEADRYFQEAKWAFRWSMFKEACVACEASWALGRQTKETADLCIRAYHEAGGQPGACVIEPEAKRVRFDQPFHGRVYEIDQMAAFAVPTDAERFADVVHALELYAGDLRLFARPEAELDAGWFALGTELLQRGGWWLRYFYFTAEARAGQEERISVLRRLSQEITVGLERHPGLARVDTNNNLLAVKARDAAFWMDTPEQTLAQYRKIMEAGDWPRVRTRFLNVAHAERPLERINENVIGAVVLRDTRAHADLASPCLAGWKWGDRKRCPALWSDFVDEVCQSTNVLFQLEGRYLRCSYSWSEDDYERNLKQLLDFAWDQRDALATATLDGELLCDLDTLVNSRLNELSGERCKRIKETIWAKFEHDFSELGKQRAQRLAESKMRTERAVWLETRKDHLRTRGTFDFSFFTLQLLHQKYQPEEAKELLPLLLDYKVRLDSTNATTNTARRTPLPHCLFVSRLEQELRDTISPPASNNVTAQAITKQQAQRVILPTTGTTDPHTLAFSNALHVSRFWKFPAKPDYPGRQRTPQLMTCCYRDGRLWMEVGGGRSYRDVDFVGVDLDTFRARVVEYNNEKYDLPGQSVEGEGHQFEIHRGCLYLGLWDSVARYDLGTDEWKPFPFPIAGRVRPVRLGDRLFFTSDSTILEYTAAGEFRLLASNRRKPPVTALDVIDHYGLPPLFQTAGGIVNACVGGRVFSLSTQTNDWQFTAAIPKSSYDRFFLFDDGIISTFVRTSEEGELWAMRGNDVGFQLLFRQPARLSARLIPFYALEPKTNPNTNTPCWNLPDDIRVAKFAPCLENDKLWLLAGTFNFQSDPVKQVQLKETNGWHILLFRFTPGEAEPIRIPLLLAFESTGLSDFSADMLLRSSNKQVVFQSTPKGLVISCEFVPGFWFVPKTDLDPLIQAQESQHRAERETAKAKQEAVRKELLAVHDRNHNGLFDPAEIETAITDPRFLAAEVENIDANNNGLLDADELAFFDVNGNRRLESREHEAVEATMTNLAAKLFARLDQNKNGKLTANELCEGPGKPPLSTWTQSSVARPGPDHHLGMDLDALIQVEQQRLNRQLRPLAPGKLLPDALRSQPLVNPRILFSLRVEEYWAAGNWPRAVTAPKTNSSPTPHPSQP